MIVKEQDRYRVIATKVFKVPYEEVTEEQRAYVKKAFWLASYEVKYDKNERPDE